MSNFLAHRAAAALPLWLLTLSGLPVPVAGAAVSSCGHLLSQDVVQHRVIDISGGQRVREILELPAGTEAVVVAGESGADVRIEVQPDNSGPLRAADNPVRRLGPQRIVVPPTRTRRATVEIVSKEPVPGHVELSVLRMPQAAACLAALRLQAQGDASYSRAQLISLGQVEGGRGEAKREYEAAARSYQRAADALTPTGASELLAHAQLSAAAAQYQGVQDWAAALSAARAAEKSFGLLGDEYGQNRARSMAAAAEMEVAFDSGNLAPADATKAQRLMTTHLERARRTLREVIASHKRRGEPYDTALALNNLGLAFYYQDLYAPALDAYAQAITIYRQLGERRREVQSLQNIAVVQTETARFAESSESFEQALSLLVEADDPQLYADMLNNLALNESRAGDPDAALRHYSDALAILTRIQSAREQARSLHGIGLVYTSLGNRGVALDYFERALALRTPALDPVGRIDSLRAAADGLRVAGRTAEALAHRQEALELTRTPLWRSRILVELARDQAASGAPDRALASVQAALSGEVDDIVRARALVERAKDQLARRSLPEALRDASTAAALFKTYEMQTSRFDALLLQARIACARGDFSATSRFADQALGMTEQLRRASANPALRAALLQPLRPAFDFKLALHANAKTCGGSPTRAPEAAMAALGVAEQSRSRALEDYLRMSGKRMSGPNAAARARRQALFNRVAASRMHIETLSRSVQADDPRITSLRADIASQLRALDVLDSETAASARETARGETSTSRLRTIVETIPPDVAVVEYWLGDSQTYAWLITKKRVQMFDLGPTSLITSAAHQLHDALAKFSTVSMDVRQQSARKLHSLVLAPLQSELPRGSTLVFVPDGALHYIPFAVLADGARYLIDEHDIAVAPSLALASVTLEQTGLQGASRVLLVSDPIYSRSDERVAAASAPASELRKGLASLLTLGGTGNGTGGELARLPGSAREADAIAALFPPNLVDTLSGPGATREALLGRDLSLYRVLHIATHGVADVEAPQLSTLVLSRYDRGGRAIPSEVFAGDLLQRRIGADLVVLSACETSLGQESAGEGLLGLRYAAHASGARSVVASLWPVSDVVSAGIMTDFYSRWAPGRDSSVAALSQAMRAARTRWEDPALWGVFEVSKVAREPTLH